MVVSMNVVFRCKPSHDFVDDGGLALLIEAGVLEIDV